MKNPYTTDELVEHLQFFWAKAEGLEYGQEHEVMKCAADRLQRLAAHCLRLERKIRNQRRANRDNWEIVEMRRKWMGHPVAFRRYCDLSTRYRELVRATAVSSLLDGSSKDAKR